MLGPSCWVVLPPPPPSMLCLSLSSSPSMSNLSNRRQQVQLTVIAAPHDLGSTSMLSSPPPASHTDYLQPPANIWDSSRSSQYDGDDLEGPRDNGSGCAVSAESVVSTWLN
ncbi:hypothetical protein C8R43DRAFT_966287 [Mycena crocata]|nr:hypothetical protein C8R43DRAFT_966287 [Mycena crocata]